MWEQSMASPYHPLEYSNLKWFIKGFKEIIECLPENIPIGSGNNTLAAFSFEPALLNNPKISHFSHPLPTDY
jgi:hypothetical protein